MIAAQRLQQLSTEEGGDQGLGGMVDGVEAFREGASENILPQEIKA